MQANKIKAIISALGLEPHPEGGYYKETYRSEKLVQRNGDKRRAAGTGIYFLLPGKVCTSWHRVTSDELWHFYEGDKLILEIIDPDGNFKQLPLCDKLSADCSYQRLVPQNCWQRAYSTGAYSLVGCTVTPGFEFEDFEMIEQEKLADRYPDIAEKIKNDPFPDL
jgi:predicted cupin superfamily sugar epimerase